MSENTKILKFTILVEDVNRVIQPFEISEAACIASEIVGQSIVEAKPVIRNFFRKESESSRNSSISNGVNYFKGINTVKSPLRLFIDSKKTNEYSKVILNNAKFKLDEWAEYTSGRSLMDLKENILMTKKLIEILRNPTNKRESLNFIFWLLFISTVDNADYDEKISTIADLSYMIGLSDEVIKDLTNVVKVVLGDEDSKVKITTEEVYQNFCMIINPIAALKDYINL